MDQVGMGLCPSLIYVNCCGNEEYVQKYVCETNGLYLEMNEIEKILARKKLPVPDSV